jgi:hypothetical protein
LISLCGAHIGSEKNKDFQSTSLDPFLVPDGGETVEQHCLKLSYPLAVSLKRERDAGAASGYSNRLCSELEI